MESYTPLLEKTRLPQPSLQKFAVISIFSKLRSTPSQLGPDSELGREVISLCLGSSSAAVVDQSVRELCRLVSDSNMELSRGLMELQSALEGTEPKFVGLFVKGVGFLVRSGFERSNGLMRFDAEGHPFCKVLLCRSDTGDDLVQQVLLFVLHNKQSGMVKICDFLRSFLIPLVLRVPFLDFSVASVVMDLLKSMASICCSFASEAIPMFKLLIGCIKYLPHENDDYSLAIHFAGHMVDAYVVILKHLVVTQAQISEIQLCGVELLETVLGLNLFSLKSSCWTSSVIELANCVLVLQKDLGLRYVPEVSSVTLSLFYILVQSELEHEQLSMLKLVHHILGWKSESWLYHSASSLSEELLFMIPIINLMSWPSKCVKGAAGELIVTLEKIVGKLLISSKNNLPLEEDYPSVSKPGKIVLRLLQHLWFQDKFSSSRFFIDAFASIGPTPIEGVNDARGPWASKLREYTSWIVQRRKSSMPITKSQEVFVTEMPFLVCSVAGALVIHQLRGTIAVDVLASMGALNPKLGVPLLLAVLFFSNIYAGKDVCGDILVNILGVLPLLASHSSMIPLVIQTILPLLQRDTKPVLYPTATRLLCRTWEINDRAFGSLQGILLPKHFSELVGDRNACLSMASSLRDVCRKNPDRGVDLILSISTCIESRDAIVQALGLQSLSHLCEADAVDFYTAWDVIKKHLLDSSTEPILAYSICGLLRWGAMDAEAYPEASRNILQTLWGFSSSELPHESKWSKARKLAFDALIHYEISFIENTISEFKERSCALLFLETDEDVLSSMERFQVKVIMHEHKNRRRLTKERRVASNKIEKLLDAFPRVIFSSGKNNQVQLLPGAALLCLSLTPKLMKSRHGSADVHAEYEKALTKIASSLQLSGNYFITLLSLQSWKTFLRRWIKATTLTADSGVSSSATDRTCKAANDILKSLVRIAEDSIPRISENIVMAIGALCAILPPSAHTVKSAASTFLMDWLYQFEHEHRRWSAAISLGLVSSGLHVTDHKQKLQNITGLIEVLHGSKSTLVKGACGIGLGFSCQGLLTRREASDNTSSDQEAYRMREIELLGKIVRSLSLMISELTRSSSEFLHDLSEYFPKGTYATAADIDLDLNEHDVLEEDVWGLAGLVLGLGGTVCALYGAGEHDIILKIKDLIISWIPHLNRLAHSSGSGSGTAEVLLSVGSCLALPMVVAFCYRVELMDISKVEHLIHGYRELIYDLVSVQKSGFFHESFLMASCAAAGSLLAYVLHEGVSSVECVEGLLELFKKCYSNPNPPIIHFGGMLGVVNSLGAEAGMFHNHFTSSVWTGYVQKGSSTMGHLLSNPVCGTQLTSLMQEIFLAAQVSDDHQLQHYAAWAVSLLRNSLVSREANEAENDVSADSPSLQVAPHTFPDDSVVIKLCTWLMNLGYPKVPENRETGTFPNIRTIKSVLKCLTQAPRLPNFDWGAIIRRCMRYEAQVLDSLPADVAIEEGGLRKESLRFALAHASNFDQLLTLLDELWDLPRFRSLEPNLQSCMLFHLAEIVKLFSGSRVMNLLQDLADFLRSLTTDQIYDSSKKRLLRISCWKGLSRLLEEAAPSSTLHMSDVNTCISILFLLLPYQSDTIPEMDRAFFEEEFSEAVRCFEKVPRDCLSTFLQVDSIPGEDQVAPFLKMVELKARLVRVGTLPVTELGRVKALILNTQSPGTWNVLIEVVAAMQLAEGSVKREWLVDAVEISCASRYPSLAMQFIGLLGGSCSKYMPLLILDPVTVLSDLPVTLTSLLADSTWASIAERLTASLLASLDRLHSWMAETLHGEEIDEGESRLAPFVVHVMHEACVCLRKYLPLEKQISLADMSIPEFRKM